MSNAALAMNPDHSLKPSSYTSENVHSPNYTSAIFDVDQFPDLVKRATARVIQILQLHPEIEAMAACGHSGELLMAALSYTTGLPMLAVRKSLAGSRCSTNLAGGYLGAKGYLIIDDLISSGATVARIVNHIEATVKQENSDRQAAIDRIKNGNRWYGDKSRPLLTTTPVPVAALLHHHDNDHALNYRLDDNNGRGYTFKAYSLSEHRNWSVVSDMRRFNHLYLPPLPQL